MESRMILEAAAELRKGVNDFIWQSAQCDCVGCHIFLHRKFCSCVRKLLREMCTFVLDYDICKK